MSEITRLTDRLVVLARRIGRDNRRGSTHRAHVVHAMLHDHGIVHDHCVPTDIVFWLVGIGALREPANVVAGWRLLSLDAALAERVVLLEDGAPLGPWLPLATNDRGDYHIYSARTHEYGTVVWGYSVGATRRHVVYSTLLGYAEALCGAWPATERRVA